MMHERDFRPERNSKFDWYRLAVWLAAVVFLIAFWGAMYLALIRWMDA